MLRQFKLRRYIMRACRRFAVLAIVLAAVLGLAGSGQESAQAGGHSHLYVLLGLANMSPGLSEFGAEMSKRGVPTTVSNYMAWPQLASDAISQYKKGRLRSIMIVGHSYGADAGKAMAAALGKAGVPVRLLVGIAATDGVKTPSNVRRSVNIVPEDDEGHFSVIAARKRELTRYVLGR